MTGPLVVFARFLAKAGEEDGLREELLKAIGPTRDQADNLFCDLHQATEQPAVFIVHEGWRCPEALRAHRATPQFQALRAAIDSLLAEPANVLQTQMISSTTLAEGADTRAEPRRPRPPFPPQELVSPHGAG